MVTNCNESALFCHFCCKKTVVTSFSVVPVYQIGTCVTFFIHSMDRFDNTLVAGAIAQRKNLHLLQ